METIYITLDDIAGYNFADYGNPGKSFSDESKEGGWEFEECASWEFFDEDEANEPLGNVMLGCCFYLHDEDDLGVLRKMHAKYGIHNLPEKLEELFQQ